MVRYLDIEEYDMTKDLYRKVFDDKEEFIEFYYGNRISKNRILVELIDNEIASMLQLVPRIFMMKDKEVNVDYIFAVATQEKYREKGMMTDLLKKAIKDMNSEGKPFTYLVEGGYNNYQRVGFGTMNEVVEGYFEAEKSDETLFLRSVKPMDEEELSNYGIACLTKNKRIYLKRDGDYYFDAIRMLEIDNGTVEKLVDTAGNIMAFCFVTQTDGIVTASEITSKYGYERQMLNLICQKYNVDKIKIIADEKSKIYNKPWIKQELFGKRTHALARVLNLKALGELIPYNKDIKKIIKINDEIIEENNDVFEISENKNGNILFEKTDKIPDLEFSMEEFSSLVFGNGVDLGIRIEGSDLIWLHEEV